MVRKLGKGMRKRKEISRCRMGNADFMDVSRWAAAMPVFFTDRWGKGASEGRNILLPTSQVGTQPSRGGFLSSPKVTQPVESAAGIQNSSCHIPKAVLALLLHPNLHL